MTNLASRIGNRLKDIYFISPTVPYWKARLEGSVMVVLYHRVIDGEDEFDFLSTSGVPTIQTSQLKRELEFLRKLGANFLTFRDLRNGSFPKVNEMGVIVTFDDGFRDTYENGLSLLNDLQIRGVVFQSTAMICHESLLYEHLLCFASSSPKLWCKVMDRIPQDLLPKRNLQTNQNVSILLENLKHPTLKKLVHFLRSSLDEQEMISAIYPSRDHLIRAERDGHEVGSHGHWHLHRSTLSDAEFREELESSRRWLDRILGKSNRAFSFPFGAFHRGDESIVSDYFSQAATCERIFTTEKSGQYRIGRFSWPGQAPNPLRFRRWLLTGKI